MNIIVVGCSRLGTRLAKICSQAGHEVNVIDPNLNSAHIRLGNDFRGHIYKGVGIDLSVLEKAGIKSADVLVAATNRDSSNLVTAQIAKEKYGVAKVVARVYDPAAVEAYKDMGLTIFCPTLIGVDSILGFVEKQDQGGNK